MVIGGYTLPVGNRRYFNSLLVGYQGPGLLFAGKVGTGFSDKVRVRLSLAIRRITRPRTKSRGFASMHLVLA